MARRKTILLALLLIVSFLTMAIAYLRMSKFRDDAALAQANLVNGQLTISEIHQWKASPGRASAVTADTPELTRHLRQAATAAGLADTPGTEPEPAKAVGNSDYSEMALDLRFEPLTLRQLTTFLHTLAKIDPNSRAKAIELSAPDSSAPLPGKQPAEELWRADVAVNYLTYTPRNPGK